MNTMYRSVHNLERFTEDLQCGKLRPYVKSAPQPLTNDGLVTVSSNQALIF